MSEPVEKISLDTLKGLFPLQNLSLSELDLLSDRIHATKARKGKVLVEEGESDKQAVFLLAGKVEVYTDAGKHEVIEENTSRARYPLTYSDPHKVSVKCLSPATFFRVDNLIIENLVADDKKKKASLEPLLADEQLQWARPLIEKMCEDFDNDLLRIPALPHSALHIQQLLKGECELQDIERILQNEMTMAALILKAANSPLYRMKTPSTSVEQAIIRLGAKIVSQLVARYASRNMFVAKNQMINERIGQLWVHSVTVAAYAYVLAESMPQFDAEHALALGLMHDVGCLPILYYADKYSDIVASEQKLEQLIQQMQVHIGEAIFTKWKFPQEFIEVTRQADDWDRQAAVADYSDLIMVAQLYSFVGPNVMEAPASAPAVAEFARVSAFERLGLDAQSPEQIIKFASSAQKQINNARGILNV